MIHLTQIPRIVPQSDYWVPPRGPGARGGHGILPLDM